MTNTHNEPSTPFGLRTIIVHNHLFKNAGSTIDWALRRNFGDGFVDHRDDVGMQEGPTYLYRHLAMHPHIQALSTHYLTLPLPASTDIRLLQIMMLRHPVERVTSVYEFERRQTNSNRPGPVHARQLGLAEYVAWRLQPDSGPVIRNFHVRKTLPPEQFPLNRLQQEGRLHAAKQSLCTIPLLGLVDKFDESMVLFEDVLARFFPHIDFAYLPQNVSQQPTEGRIARLQRLQSSLGTTAYESLCTHNKDDLQLLAFAEQEFEARTHSVSLFDERLTAFRARCAALTHAQNH